MQKNNLHQVILKSWSEPEGSDHFHLEVALSGGVDSVVLLHALLAVKHQMHMNWHVSAVHVNHQLQDVADTWPDFCQHLCQQWQVPLRIETVDVVNVTELGVEAAARLARYQAFAKTSANILVLAQHQNDQIETALLAFLRGGGLRALSAMPVWRDLNEHVQIWRPLLAVSKHDLQGYAQNWQLSHIEDPSNGDENYVRNWLRKNILPQMLNYDAHFPHKILAGVNQSQQELALINEIQQQDWRYVVENKIFNINRWLQLSSLRREQQLLYFAKQNNLGGWKKSKLTHFSTQLSRNPHSRHQIELSNGEIQADRGRLYAWGSWQKLPFERLGLLASNDCLGLQAVQSSVYAPLALLSQFGNTQSKKEEIQLLSLGQLRLVLLKEHFQRVVKTIKTAKIPLFLIEYWPCWFHSETHQVLVAKIQDNEVRLKHPIWDEKLAFLEPYLIHIKGSDECLSVFKPIQE